MTLSRGYAITNPIVRYALHYDSTAAAPFVATVEDCLEERMIGLIVSGVSRRDVGLQLVAAAKARGVPAVRLESVEV